MPRSVRTALALLTLFALVLVAGPVSATEIRRVMFVRRGESSAEAWLLEALRIQLAGSAEVVESQGTPTSAAPSLAREAAGAQIVVWVGEIDGEPTVLAITASQPERRLELGVAPGDPSASRVLALKVSELLDSEPGAVPPPTPPHPSSTRAFVELRGAASNGGAPEFWLPSVAFASGPRWRAPNRVLEVYGVFSFAADIRSHSAIGEVDTSLASFGAGARGLWRSGPIGLGPYLELGLAALHSRGIVDPQHQGAQELRAGTADFGLECRVALGENLELRAATGWELWLTRERLELHATPVLDFGRVRTAGALSAVVVFP